MTEILKTTYGKITAGVIAVILLMCIVSSCSRPTYAPSYAGAPIVQPQVVQPQVVAPAVTPAPVVVQSGGHSTLGESLVGSLIGSTAGSMIGNHLSRRSAEQAAPAPVARPTAPVYAPTTTAPAQRYAPQPYTAPAARPSTVTSSRGITTTTRPTSGGGTRISVGRR